MKFRSLLLLLFIASSVFPQLSKLQIPKAYFSAIIVKDIEISIKWYKKAFGFKVLHRIENQTRAFKQANLTIDGTALELIELGASLHPSDILKNEPRNTRISGFFKFGFKVEGFDDWVQFLKDADVKIHGRVVNDTVSGKKMLIVLDPDGNRIQLFEK